MTKPVVRVSSLPLRMHALTCLFNPSGYRTKLENYRRFRARLAAQGVPLFTVECAFGDSDFALDPGADVLQLRARDVMWQKERLLNLAIRALPASVDKIAWLDADLLFASDTWAAETSARLDEFPILQPFEVVIRLPQGHEEFRGQGQAWRSFASVYRDQPHELLGGNFDAHGHTGFAWAARREWVERHGLYDACIAGSGDHMMAHAFAGDWDSKCIQRILGSANAHRAWFAAWCGHVYPHLRAQLGFTPGAVHHLWHGEMADRRYVVRNRELADFAFDPASDLVPAANGVWEWSAAGERMRDWARAYFGYRREDGVAAAA